LHTLKGSIYIYFPEKTVILTGKEYRGALNQLEKRYKSEIKELSGMTASAGTATGPVKVCMTLSDINKVKEGDVLVASMTRPEFAPAMKKAVAVITDEGGITCHAAIVSRELGIPCIIGTKIATKVLKDNDLVQVKGNHGLIIILKQRGA
jgi:pyruvate,water dikinase